MSVPAPSSSVRELAANRAALVAAAEAELAAIERAQRHLKEFVSALNVVFASHLRTRELASQISQGCPAPRGFPSSIWFRAWAARLPAELTRMRGSRRAARRRVSYRKFAASRIFASVPDLADLAPDAGARLLPAVRELTNSPTSKTERPEPMAKNAAVKVETNTAEASPESREPILIKPSAVSVDHAGYATRSLVVRSRKKWWPMISARAQFGALPRQCAGGAPEVGYAALHRLG